MTKVHGAIPVFPDLSSENVAPSLASSKKLYGYGEDSPCQTTPESVYGYEETFPETKPQNDLYGYGDGAPDVAASKDLYGYGDGAPDKATSNDIYGYGDGAPDSASSSDVYGYGDGAPDKASSSYLYGYGEGAPDAYGYGDGAPDRKHSDGDEANVHRRHVYDSRRTPRRSSMKSSNYNSDCPRWKQQRRASMGTTNSPPPEETTIEILLPGQRKPVQRRRSIEFNADIDVCAVTPSVKLAESQEDLWLQPHDYSKIQKERHQVIRRLRAGSIEESDEEDDTRGLEKYLEGERAQQPQFEAWDAVLFEQGDQEESGEFDDERIAEKYREAVRQGGSSQMAADRARLDAEEARNYTLSPKTKRLMRRCSC